MLSSDLHNVSEYAHNKYKSPIQLDYTYNGKEDPTVFTTAVTTIILQKTMFP